MSLILLHGVVDADTAYHTADRAHRIIPCGPFAALVSDLGGRTGVDAPTPEELAGWALAHNDILCAYCGDTDILPMRLGTLFSTDEAITEEIARTAETLGPKLAALRGLREYTVRLCIKTSPTAAPSPVSSGRAHLLARKAHRDRRAHLGRDRKDFARHTFLELQTIARHVAPAQIPRPDHTLDCTALVHVDQRVNLSELAKTGHVAALPLGLDLIISGPWPPYSFDLATPPEKELCHGT